MFFYIIISIIYNKPTFHGSLSHTEGEITDSAFHQTIGRCKLHFR